VHVCECVRVQQPQHLSVCLACKHTYIYACLYVCLRACTCVCVCVCVGGCVGVHVCVRVHDSLTASVFVCHG